MKTLKCENTFLNQFRKCIAIESNYIVGEIAPGKTISSKFIATDCRVFLANA